MRKTTIYAGSNEIQRNIIAKHALGLMNFDPTEEQQLLAASIARFVERDYTFETRRAHRRVGGRRESRRLAHDGRAWACWAFRCRPRTAVSAVARWMRCALMEAIGGALIVEPWLATVALGARLVARGGSDAQKQHLLPPVAEGCTHDGVCACRSRLRATRCAHVATRAAPSDDGFVLDRDQARRRERAAAPTRWSCRRASRAATPIATASASSSSSAARRGCRRARAADARRHACGRRRARRCSRIARRRASARPATRCR